MITIGYPDYNVDTLLSSLSFDLHIGLIHTYSWTTDCVVYRFSNSSLGLTLSYYHIIAVIPIGFWIHTARPDPQSARMTNISCSIHAKCTASSYEIYKLTMRMIHSISIVTIFMWCSRFPSNVLLYMLYSLSWMARKRFRTIGLRRSYALLMEFSWIPFSQCTPLCEFNWESSFTRYAR